MPDQRARSAEPRESCDAVPRARVAVVSNGRTRDRVDDPIAKLRYLRTNPQPALEPEPRTLATGVRHFLRRVGAARQAFSTHAPIEQRRSSMRTLGAIAAIAFVVAPAIVAVIASQLSSTPPIAPAQALPEVAPSAALPPSPPISPTSAQPQPATAETLPADVMGLLPATIWLADRGTDWELYSNGLRIETAQSVQGAPRRFRIYARNGSIQPQVYTKPVGILFHTSESDLWPLEESFQRDLRRSSSGLVRYVRKERAYNYLIDRFGRVYRIVDEETKANHAGRGVWMRNDEVYVDLNDAFIGVSLESRWGGGRTLPITRAQLTAGRNLTNYLRQRFAIAPEMCVTHGLTSVSPRQQLIGYHRDWARGFPFEAFGLPDLYAQPTPSVAWFGFRYDDDFLRSVGEAWPGLIAAETMFANEARERGVAAATLRQERQALYAKWARDAATLDESDSSLSAAAE